MYKVRIDSFEGPFDLLVYLLENAKMNIYDIKVAEITNQYVDYLREMDSLDVEVGSEFIVLAATLIKLKARMLLPRSAGADEEGLTEDPRAELATRLAEYLKAKKAAAALQKCEEGMIGIYEKPGEDISEYLANPLEIIKTDEDKLIKAFRAFIERKKNISDVERRYVKVKPQGVSVDERIEYISDILNKRFRHSTGVDFTDLIPDRADKADITLSFISLLEMIRERELDASQDCLYGNIRVHKCDKNFRKNKNAEVENDV